MTEAAIKRVYVDKSGIATFVCTKCGDALRKSAERYKDHTGPVKIKCKCGNIYEVELEFRQYFRKQTSLAGSYFRTSHPRDSLAMIVRDLAPGGCRFETMEACDLVPGEEIGVEFVLDVSNRLIIKRKAVTVHVRGRHIGCKFSVLPGTIDSDIAFYLKKS